MASSTSIRIHTASPLPRGVLYVPRVLLRELGITPGSRLLTFGAKSTSVLVREWQVWGAVANVVHASPDVVAALHLPQYRDLPLTVAKGGLRLGEVMGILADVKTNGDRVAGKQEEVFRHLLQAAEELGMYGYVFSPLSVNWEDLSAAAYRCEDGKWIKCQVPLPDVVYDQITSRAFEKRKDVAPVRERLQRLLGARYFNPGYFDKWQVHEWLSADPRTASHVPETIRYQTVDQAAEFMYRHADVYMKPVHGSLGIGIMRVRRKPNGQVLYQLKKKDGSLQQVHVGSVSQFLKTEQRRLSRGQYLIQEALQLMTWQGRPFDIRLVLQKDDAGNWQRTKTFGRIAQTGQITSNLSTGGDALAVRGMLKEILKEDRAVKRVMNELRKIARDVPAVIEQRQSGTIGELGLDLGLDEGGRLWVIEVNAKPWKKPNIEEGEWRDLSLLAFRRPVQFAQYLCSQDRDG